MLSVNEEHLDKITEAFYRILKGQRPDRLVLPDNHPDDEINQVVEYINRFLDEHIALTDSIVLMSKGDLDFESPKGKMIAAQSLKNLQANLRHLTWKTQQIAEGDFTNRVDFMGDFSAAFNSMARQLKEAFEKIEQQNTQLSEAYDT